MEGANEDAPMEAGAVQPGTVEALIRDLDEQAQALKEANAARKSVKWTLTNVALAVGVVVTALGVTLAILARGPVAGLVVAAGTTLFALLTRLGWQNHAIQAEKRFGDYEYVVAEVAVLRAGLPTMEQAEIRSRLTELHGVMREARKTFW